MNGILILAHGSKKKAQEIESMMVKYPGIRTKMGKHIDDYGRIADILVDRINSVE